MLNMRRSALNAPARVWVAAVALLALPSCAGQDDAAVEPVEDDATAALAAVDAEARKPQRVPLAPAPSLAEITKRVAEAAERAGSARMEALEAALAGAGHDEKVARSLYADGKGPRYYQADGNLTADGEAVMALLAALDRHGLDPAGYRIGDLDAATAAVVGGFVAERDAILSLGSDVRVARVGAAVVDWVRRGEGGEASLRKAGAGELDDRGRRALADGLDKLTRAATETGGIIALADVEISRAVVRYVVDFEHARPAHPFDYMSPATIAKLAARRAERVPKSERDRVKPLIERLADSRGETAKRMRSTWPRHPQYRPLLGAVDQYVAMAEDGGWKALPKLPRKKLEKGYKGPWITQLRERLAAEGYDVPDAEDPARYDSELVKVVQAFQARHHLTDDGIIARGTAAALNVSIAQRLRELRLALQRLREANGRDAEGQFFWVNVAAQQVWLYEDGKVLRNHRVIVGNDRDDIDYDKRIKGKINRTRLFSARMTKLTLAPRWYPTPRVIDLELGPALAKEPDYFEKHGYVSEMQPDGTEKVYQLSGPSNLLGKVKFQFPNRHAIYMHDTPGRHLFKKTRRAYSHGCIRLHEPVKLAEFVLGRDRGWSRKKIKEIIDEREEKVVMLRTPIDVHIDYVGAGVDEDGAVVFWSDIYDYDQAYFSGQLPVVEVEEYKPASVKGLLK